MTNADCDSEDAPHLTEHESQDHNERVLHKMITNTLQYYEISSSFNSDDILSMYKKNNLM